MEYLFWPMIIGDMEILKDYFTWFSQVDWETTLDYYLGFWDKFCSLFDQYTFEDAASQPILTTIDTVDVTSIPFPAVTVIPGKYFSKNLFHLAMQNF